MTEGGRPFDVLAVEALKAIGKTLGQMNLYRIGHPAVMAMLQEAQRTLQEMLESSGGGEVVYTFDGEKLVANGRVVGTASQLPNAVASLFSRYKLNSLSFRPGISDTELIALCELAALRPEQARGVDLASYFAEKDVSHISVNEAVYTRVEKAAETPPPARSGTPASQAAAEPAAGLAGAVSAAPLERSLEELVRAAVPDTTERSRILGMVMQRLREDIERQIHEVTQGLQREKTRLENEQLRTQAVLSNMAEGVVVVDEQGKVLMMNPAAEALYGVRLVEAAGKPLADAVKEEHLLTLATEIATPQDRMVQNEVEIVSTEDTRQTLRASTALVQNEQGKPVGMVSVLSDVTKHKELQKREREFIAHVTHELRAPLSSIRAALEILGTGLTEKLADEDKRVFGTALKNTDRLEALINGILDFAKIEGGQMSVLPKPRDPAEIAKDGVEGLRPWCQKKGIGLSLVTAPDLPLVLADSDRTIQVLVNLLSNAIKFTPSGGRIDVSVTRGTGARQKSVVFSVKDTGPGIAPKDQPRVFEKFVQIASGEKHVGGTGLGLAIAKALIHLQNGQMWIESDLGRGADFLFALPVHVAPRESATAPSAPRARPWWKRLFGVTSRA